MKTREQIQRKEEKELARWKAMKAKPVSKWYIPLMVVIVAMVTLLDSLASDLHTNLQELEISYYSSQLGIDYNSVLSVITVAGLFTMAASFVSPFYKALADKYGRKRLFVISSAGMGLGMLAGFLSSNLVIFLLGRVLLTFFVVADIQVIYIMEVAPSEKRARLFSLTKFIGLLGILAIPLCRDFLLNEDGSNWRTICLVPTVIAAVAVVAIVLLIRESDVFLDKKIAWLETPYEVRFEEQKKDKENRRKSKNKAGVFNAFGYIFRNKQARAVVIAYALFLCGMYAFVGYYNTICMMRGMNTDDITKSLYMYPILAALITLVSGYIADKLGRRKLCGILAVTALLGLGGYIALAGSVSPYVVGILYGVCWGSYWGIGDCMYMMLAESSRTEVRSSVVAASGLLNTVASTIAIMLFGSLMLAVDIVVLCLVIGVITMGIMLLLVIFTIKETKGVDMKTIE